MIYQICNIILIYQLEHQIISALLNNFAKFILKTKIEN